jgi:hypothetical protein
VFKRLLWLIVGAGFGFGCSWWITRAVRRTIERATPDQLRGMLHTLPTLWREALAEGREAMIERELELRAILEPGGPSPAQLYPARLRERVGVVYLPPGEDRSLGPVEGARNEPARPIGRSGPRRR